MNHVYSFLSLPNFEKNSLSLNGQDYEFTHKNIYQLKQVLRDIEKNTLLFLSPQDYLHSYESLKENPYTHVYIIENIVDKSTIVQQKKVLRNKYERFLGMSMESSLPLLKQQMIQALEKFYDISGFHKLSLLRQQESDIFKEISEVLVQEAGNTDVFQNVLSRLLKICPSDAGFMFILDKSEPGPGLRLVSQRFSLSAKTCSSQDISPKPQFLSSPLIATLSHSLSFIHWAEGETLIQDAYPELDFNTFSYKIRSFCAIPITTPSDQVIGYVLLVNKLKGEVSPLKSHKDIEEQVLPYQGQDLKVLHSVCQFIGVSLDHGRLIKELHHVFESFIQASITAIESRDPTTKGHSDRVASLTVGLAEAVNRGTTGVYGNITFTANQIHELRYAALLHDFGKIGVREDVLRKEKKLMRYEMQCICDRMGRMEKQLHVQKLEQYIMELMAQGRSPQPIEVKRIQKELEKVSLELEKIYATIGELNEPTVLHEDQILKLQEIAKIRIQIKEGQYIPILLPEEIEKLSIQKGSLSPSERLEIESHVVHSYRFLIQIPWSSEYSNIPDIVHAHHEKLDGSGYPRRLSSEEIPIQAKMMAITDIYDALVAMDRPYKRSMTHEQALNILESEVKANKLDKTLFQIFTEAKIAEVSFEEQENENTRQAA